MHNVGDIIRDWRVGGESSVQVVCIQYYKTTVLLFDVFFVGEDKKRIFRKKPSIRSTLPSKGGGEGK